MSGSRVAGCFDISNKRPPVLMLFRPVDQRLIDRWDEDDVSLDRLGVRSGDRLAAIAASSEVAARSVGASVNSMFCFRIIRSGHLHVCWYAGSMAVTFQSGLGALIRVRLPPVEVYATSVPPIFVECPRRVTGHLAPQGIGEGG